MSDQDRQAFIASMVEGLRERLDTDGGSADEWVRLIRAYPVLGRKDDARLAYQRATKGHAADETALAFLKDSAEALGVNTGTAVSE